METWGIVEAAAQSETPVLSLRSISDGSSERLPDMGSIYNGMGRLDPKRALRYFTSNPSCIFPYLRFRFINSPRASHTLNLSLLETIRGL